jgi:hypothetical protein
MRRGSCIAAMEQVVLLRQIASSWVTNDYPPPSRFLI